MENRSSLFGIIALIIGASGLGLGAYSVVNFQVVEGPQGPPGQDGQDGLDGIDGFDGINGTDGQDAPGGLVVGILDPDDGETIFGEVTIRALIYGSENYTISVKLNGSLEIGTTLPLIWDTSTVTEGYWNLSIWITDNPSNNMTTDSIIVLIKDPMLFKGGIWESLQSYYLSPPYTEGYNWLVRAADNTVLNDEYINVTDSDTRFWLLKDGFFCITIKLLLEGLANTYDYVLSVWKNDVLEEYGYRLDNPPDIYYYISISFFIYSDGDDNIRLNWWEITGVDSFSIINGGAAALFYCQLAIEYAGT